MLRLIFSFIFVIFAFGANVLAHERAASEIVWTIAVSPEQKSRLEPMEALAMINEYRSAHDVAPLRLNPLLVKTALGYSEEMAGRDSITHHSSGGAMLAHRLTKAGYDPFRAAENLSGGQRDFAEAFQAWIDSPTHRKNILNPELEELGIAVSYRKNSQYRTFWVMILATPF